MISPIRSLCFNDDHQTFTIVLPSQYRVFRCDPFGMIFSRECEDLSLGSVATYDGYRYLALTGSPSPSKFNSKCLKVFDHQTGQTIFDNQLEDHILCVKLGDGIAICCMHLRVQIWLLSSGQPLRKLNVGLNVHVPIAMSPDSKSMIIAGPNAKQVSHFVNIAGQIKGDSFAVDQTAVNVVVFSADGQLFATSGFNGNVIRVWSSQTHQCMAILERKFQGDVMQTMEFSPDCNFLASCSKSGSVRVYDIRVRQPNANKETPPLTTIEVGSVTMPRLTWMSPSLIGVVSLLGDFYKIGFNGSELSVESTPFLKRAD